MNYYRIYDKNNVDLGTVSAKSENHAKIRAVGNNIVGGKKQISKVILEPYDDPYEQSWADIYGK